MPLGADPDVMFLSVAQQIKSLLDTNQVTESLKTHYAQQLLGYRKT